MVLSDGASGLRRLGGTQHADSCGDPDLFPPAAARQVPFLTTEVRSRYWNGYVSRMWPCAAAGRRRLARRALDSQWERQVAGVRHRSRSPHAVPLPL
jgi:hypothetical protein